MKSSTIVRITWVIGALSCAACSSVAVDSTDPSEAPPAEGATQDLAESARPPVLPHPGGTGELVAWGGVDSSRWRPEATIANATSEALNRAWTMPGVTDVVVAVPASMVSSQFSEFGDGQLNALSTLGAWQLKERPPVVGVLVTFANGPKKAILRFDRSMALTASSFEVVYYANGRKTVDLPISTNADGDFEAEWAVPSEVGFDSLTSNAAVVVHPKGWRDWFPLWFRMPVRKTTELNARTVSFSDGRNVFDREGVSVQHETTPSQTPYERLASHTFQVSYNGQGAHPLPYNPQDIHARFPTSGGMITTGVGQGWTWVADERPNAFKVMYTCFEARRPDLEAQYGVASGGGWHLIGDSAETIINDLEAGPLVVGAAMTNPFTSSGLPSGGFSYGLTDVITVRWLHPGEAFVTPRGGAITDAAGQRVPQDNFHWYYFSSGKSSCTEELVNTGAVPQDFQP